jgi:hypothetical protein
MKIKRIKYQKMINQLLEIPEYLIFHGGKIRISKLRVVKYRANLGPKCGLPS